MNKESAIDRKYREFILQRYFNHPVLKGTSQCHKWVSPCPFCSSSRKSESKRNEKVSALLWNETQRSWVFTCRRKTCLHRSLSFPKLIESLNVQLFLEYQQERFHAGSTGFQTNCPNPAALSALKSSRPFPGGSGRCPGSHGSNRESNSRSHQNQPITQGPPSSCLLYTSDAADE